MPGVKADTILKTAELPLNNSSIRIISRLIGYDFDVAIYYLDIKAYVDIIASPFSEVQGFEGQLLDLRT